jgi:hypothetical protein
MVHDQHEDRIPSGQSRSGVMVVGLAIGTAAMREPLLLLTVPAGAFIWRVAVGAGAGIGEGLEHRLRRALGLSSQRRSRLTVVDEGMKRHGGGYGDPVYHLDRHAESSSVRHLRRRSRRP